VTSITGSNYVSVSANTGAVTLYNQGVTNITTGSGIVVTAATGTVNISSIDTLNLVTTRGSTSSAVVYFNNASSSSNSIAGNALQVPNGGIGAGTIYATGNVYANGLQVATLSYVSTNTVANIQQGPGISVTANTGSVTVNNTGVIALLAGTDITVSGTGSYPGSGNVTVNTTASLRSVTFRGATTPYAITVSSSTNATSSSTGALIVSGGVGVGKDLQVGGTVTIGSTGVAQVSSVANDTTNTSQTITVDSFAISTYRTAKYVVQSVELGNTPNKVHVEEILVFHDNNGLSTIPNIIQYGLGYNVTELGSWNAIYSGGNILLQFTPNYTPTNLVVKAVRIAVTG
jgi:cytochrome c-type biogenesis protein CcmE